MNKLGKLLERLRQEFLAEKGAVALEWAEGVAAKPAAAVRKVAIKPKAKPAAAGVSGAEGPQPLPEVARKEVTADQCKAATVPSGKYKDACAQAKECLATIARQHMTLGVEDGLETYSPKYAAMLERIGAAPGSSLVYSQFLDMEGIGIFRVAMDVNGYCPIEIVQDGGTWTFSRKTEESFRRGTGDRLQYRYITFSGGEDQKVRSLALDLFNAKLSELTEPMVKVLREAGFSDNKQGEICRVFCITSAGAEGLSLRNVRAVHIMEPYWNEVRLRQVKGRAIRIGSHLDLPEDQRDVSIYTYVSIFPEVAQSKAAKEYRVDESLLIHDSLDAKKALEAGLPVPRGARTYVLTTDEMIYSISERKRKIIEGLEKVLKQSAVDCEINYKQNKEGESFRCLPLVGKVGDFVYAPSLEQDIKEAAGRKVAALPPAAAAAPAVAPAAPAAAAPPAGPVEADLQEGEFHKLFMKVKYIMKPTMTPDGTPNGFQMLDPVTRELKGLAGIKAGKPAPPVEFITK